MEPTKEDKPNFESTLDQYILANIGLSLNSPDLTPMDNGECKYMLRQMHKDYVVPMSKQLQERDAKIAELEESVTHWETAYHNSTDRERQNEKQIDKLESENERLKSELDKAYNLGVHDAVIGCARLVSSKRDCITEFQVEMLEIESKLKK